MKKILNLSRILSAITITILLSSNNTSLTMSANMPVIKDLTASAPRSAQVRPDGTVDPYGIVNRGDGNLYYIDASGAEQSLPFYKQLTPSGRPQLTAAGKAFFNKQPIQVEAPVIAAPEVITDIAPERVVSASPEVLADVAAPEVVTEEPRKLPDNVDFGDIAAAVGGDKAADSRVMDSFLDRHSSPEDIATKEAGEAVAAQEQADREAAEARAAKYEADQQAENELLARAMAEGQKLQKLEAQAEADREAHDAKIAQDRADHEAREARAVQAKADQEAEKSKLAEALELGQKLETLEAKAKAAKEAAEAVAAQDVAAVETDEAITAALEAAPVVADPVTDVTVDPRAAEEAGRVADYAQMIIDRNSGQAPVVESVPEVDLDVPAPVTGGSVDSADIMAGSRDSSSNFGDVAPPTPIIVEPGTGSTAAELGYYNDNDYIEGPTPTWKDHVSNQYYRTKNAGSNAWDKVSDSWNAVRNHDYAGTLRGWRQQAGETLSNLRSQARDKVYGWKYQGEQARDRFVADAINPDSNSYAARTYRSYGDARSYGAGLSDEAQEHGYKQTALNIINRTRDAETRRTGDVAVIAGATAAAAAATYGVYKAYKWLTRKAELSPEDEQAQAAAAAAKALVQEEARKDEAASLRSSQNDKLRELSRQSARLRSSLRSGSRARAL